MMAFRLSYQDREMTHIPLGKIGRFQNAAFSRVLVIRSISLILGARVQKQDCRRPGESKQLWPYPTTDALPRHSVGRHMGSIQTTTYRGWHPDQDLLVWIQVFSPLKPRDILTEWKFHKSLCSYLIICPRVF